MKPASQTPLPVEPLPDQPLRILLLEDVPQDAELIRFELQQVGAAFTTQVVASEPAFRIALREFAPDIILADFSLPSFDGLTALSIARELRCEAPFIFVSGSIGEENVAALFRSGATDLVVKHNLSRLAPSVSRALRELRQRLEARRAVEALRQTIDVLRDTKQAFKSRTLGHLREKLERLVETTPWW